MQCTRMTAVLITALMVAGGLGNTAEAREPVRHGAPQARGVAVVDHLPAHERHTVSKHRYQHRGQRYRHWRHFSGNRHRYQRGAPDRLGKPGYRYHGRHARHRALRPGYRIHGHYRERALAIGIAVTATVATGFPSSTMACAVTSADPAVAETGACAGCE